MTKKTLALFSFFSIISFSGISGMDNGSGPDTEENLFQLDPDELEYGKKYYPIIGGEEYTYDKYGWVSGHYYFFRERNTLTMKANSKSVPGETSWKIVNQYPVPKKKNLFKAIQK